MSMRRSNWPALLALFIEEKQSQPFDWKHNNCAFFACDWLAILTGADPAADYRDCVDSALSAARVMKESEGLERIAEQACAQRNWLEVAPSFARRGDIVVCDTPEPTLGVCEGRHAIFASTASNGLLRIPMNKCRRAWRIE